MADMFASDEDLASLLQRGVDTASAVLAMEISTAVVQAAADGQRILLVEDDEEEVWGGTGSELPLTQRPIVAVSSVTYAGSALSQGTTSGTWRRSSNGIWRDLGWAEVTHEPSLVTVVYTHGYDPAGSDRDKQALQLARGASLSLARGLFTNPDGTIREQIDDYAVAYEKASAALDASPALKNLIRKQYGRKAALVRVI